MKSIELREADFKKEVENFILYPPSMRLEFFNYWTEPNKSGTRMKWELEKTWHLGRRLARWANNDFGKGKAEVKKAVIETPLNEFSEIDKDLLRYKDRPTIFPFESFGKWYDLLKTKKMLKPFSKQEVEDLRDIYGSDNFKCRCAAVMLTFDWYWKLGYLFSDTLKVRAV